MKKFIEKIKDLRNIVKFISFLSDALSAVVETYYKHYPQETKNNEKKGDK